MPSFLRRSLCLLASLLLLILSIPIASAATGTLGFILYDEFGQSVQGVGLELHRIGTDGSSAVVSSTRSDNSGYVYLSGIEPGSYSLRYAQGQNPTILDSANSGAFNFSVDTTGALVYDREPSDALMARRARHQGTYQLYDGSGDPIGAGGATFNVVSTEDNIDLIQNFTASGGVLTLSLPTGSYTMTNEKAPDGYDRMTDSISFTIDNQGNYKFSKNPSDAFRFKLAKGSFSFIKVDDDGVPVNGAIFKLTGEGLNLIANSTPSGTVSFSGLTPTGGSGAYTYILTETTAPPGYTRSNASVTVTIASDGTVTYDTDPATAFVNKRESFSFSFIKRNDAGDALPGSTFTLTGENNSGIYTAKSEIPSGRVYFKDIPHGIYTLTESIPSDGYSASTKKINVMIDPTGKVTYSEDPASAFASDRTRFSFSFAAKAEDGTILPGAVYTLKGGKDPIVVTAYGDGNVVFRSLLAGKYTLSQTEVPGGFTRSKETVTVTVAENGTITYSATIEATIVATIARYTVSFEKLDDGKNIVPGAVFRLTGTDYDKEITSDDSGRVVFTGLLGGAYTLSESSAPAGYKKATQTVTVTVSPTGIVTYNREPKDTFINTRSTYRFEFPVTDDAMNPLKDAVFALTAEDGQEAPLTETSRRTGKVAYDSVPFNTFILEQTQAPAGYTKSPVRVRVTVSPEGDFSYEEIIMPAPDSAAQPEYRALTSLDGVFINMTGPMSFSLEAIADDLSPVDGAGFRLTDMTTGEPRIAASNNGVAVFYNLAPGEYELTQTEAPPYYTPSEDSYRVIIERGGEIEVYKTSPARATAAALATPDAAESAAPTPTPAPTPDPSLPIFKDKLPDGETKFIPVLSFMSTRERYPVCVEVYTNDEERIPVAGAIFDIAREAGASRVDMIVTGEDGKGSSMPLAPGTYYLTAQASPVGYELIVPDGLIRVTIPEGSAPAPVLIDAAPIEQAVSTSPSDLLGQAIDFVSNNVVGVAVGGIGVLLLAALLFLILK